MARAILTLKDFSDENTSVGVYSEALTAGNFAAQETEWTALRTAIQALTLGNTARHSIAQQTEVTTLPPSDPFAQRELKWLVSYVGNVSGKTFQIEMGTADPANDHLSGNTDQADLAQADWVAFITAFEAFAKSPDDITEAVTVTAARLVGRNI